MTISRVTKDGLKVRRRLGEGIAEVDEPLATLPVRTLSELFRLAFPKPGGNQQLAAALAFAARGDFDRAYRHLDSARSAKVDIDKAARQILDRELEGIKGDTKAVERVLKNRSRHLPEDVRRAFTPGRPE